MKKMTLFLALLLPVASKIEALKITWTPPADGAPGQMTVENSTDEKLTYDVKKFLAFVNKKAR
jgi:hypothetical protein